MPNHCDGLSYRSRGCECSKNSQCAEWPWNGGTGSGRCILDPAKDCKKLCFIKRDYPAGNYGGKDYPDGFSIWKADDSTWRFVDRITNSGDHSYETLFGDCENNGFKVSAAISGRSTESERQESLYIAKPKQKSPENSHFALIGAAILFFLFVIKKIFSNWYYES